MSQERHAASGAHRAQAGARRLRGRSQLCQQQGRGRQGSREIEAAGGRAIAIQADVSRAEDVAGLFDQAELAFGGVDVLVNSAGIMKVEAVADFADATFDRIFAINVRGTFNTLKQAVKRLRRGGRMINLSTSVIGRAQRELQSRT